MNHSTNIVWGERGELFLHEKALRAYFCTGVHIILARIVATTDPKCDAIRPTKLFAPLVFNKKLFTR